MLISLCFGAPFRNRRDYLVLGEALSRQRSSGGGGCCCACQQLSSKPPKFLSTHVCELVQNSRPVALRGSGGRLCLFVLLVPAPLPPLVSSHPPSSRQTGVWGGGKPAPLPPVPTHPRQSSGCCFPHCWNSTPVCLLVPVWFQTPSSFSIFFFFYLFPIFPFTTHLLYMQRASRLSSSNKIPEATTVWFGFYGNCCNIVVMVMVQ